MSTAAKVGMGKLHSLHARTIIVTPAAKRPGIFNTFVTTFCYGKRCMANPALPRPDMPGPQPVAQTKVTAVPAVPAPLLHFSDGAMPDRVFKFAMTACGLGVLGVLALIIYELMRGSALSWHAFGFKFFAASDWDPVNEHFGALPFIYGTLVSSLLALIIAVPLSVGVAVFTTEMCPKALRGPLSFFVELLAAIPSVIYGLWAIFVLVPIMSQYIQPFLQKTLGWTHMFDGPPFGYSMLAAGVILAIMIIPIVSSIAREVLMVVPQHQREAVLALGATRWEMIRIGVLRNARAGIVGGIILGLGRALGETMAVTMVIGNRPEISKSLFAPGYTMASVLANEFSEATGDTYLSALIEIGLALFFVTIIVNALAQLLVWTVTRGQPARGNV
jgi:phosphate transport system permease protein